MTTGAGMCEAARAGSLHQVEELLEAGEDVNQQDEHGETPLIIAACLVVNCIL